MVLPNQRDVARNSLNALFYYNMAKVTQGTTDFENTYVFIYS